MSRFLTCSITRRNTCKAAGQSEAFFDLFFSARRIQLLPRQFPRFINMASPEVVPITIDGRLYRTVREGKADIVAPYSKGSGQTKDGTKPKKNIQQPAQPRNNDEGDQAVFYNPIQQYNRDLSVLAILIYGESAMQTKRERHQRKVNSAYQKRKTKAMKVNSTETQANGAASNTASETLSKKRSPDGAELDEQGSVDAGSVKRIKSAHDHVANTVTMTTDNVESLPGVSKPTTNDQQQQITENAAIKTKKPQTIPFTILDALSASGLRAIRYAKEIPFATTIIANDYSPEAVKAIDLNIRHNELADKVFSNQGDARQYMYSKTGDERPQQGPSYVHKFDVIDLDPYGTATPFLDAAIQALADGGMLCVTCTDGGVWASNGYPEKSYALYGGIPLKGAQSHEAGLRLILQSIAISAAKYGMAIEPLLSLSIDFYARLFVRVHKSQQEVKLLAGTTMIVYNCDQGCGAWETQLVSRNQNNKGKNGEAYWKHGFAQGPSAGKFCDHCGTKTHLGGPMWGGPLHNPVFVQRIIDHASSVDKTVYGTTDRIRGMLTVALEEEDIIITPSKEKSTSNSEITVNTSENGEKSTSSIIPRLPPHLMSTQPFFFLPTYLSRVFSVPTAPYDQLRGAFLGLGYTCAQSHCKPGSFKTNAPWKVIWEIMREYVRQHQSERIPRLLGEGEFEGNPSVKKASPGARILARLRGRSNDNLSIARLRDCLLEKLNYGPKSVNIESTSALRDLLTSTLYDLEHMPGKTKSESNGTNQKSLTADAASEELPVNSTEPQTISGKALIEAGGDPSELDIVFDAELGRKFRESKGGKLVRYQMNPRPNWGPMVRAGAGS